MHTLKKFIHYYGPYKAVFFLDLICATIISLVDLAYPQILRTCTNTLFTKSSSSILSALLPIAAGLLIMYLIQSLCKYYVSYQGHMMGAYMERDMRQQLFDHYEKLSFSYYDQNNSGQMMSKLVSDLFDIAEFAHHGPENLFISVIKIIGSFIFLFLINWKLAIPLLFLVFCMFAFSMSQNRRMQSTFMENRKKIGDVNSRLQDTLAGIRVVQSFANEDVEKEKFRKSNHNFLLSKDANYKCMGSFMGYNLFFQGMMYLVTLVFGGYLIAKGEMQATDLAMYALYIGIFISPIQILVELTEMMQKGLSGFRRFLDVVETEPETVLVTLPVEKMKEVELTVDLIPGGGATADNVTVDIEPRTLMVAGSAEILDQLDRISLGEIDLSKVFGTLTQSMTINLDPSLTNVSGITEAQVTVTVEGLVTKTLEAGNIEIINKPSGYEITRNTQSCTVLIRGTQEAVDAVTASQVRIVADLSNLDLSTGSRTVPVKVYLDGSSEVGVVGEYNISISVSRS